jgi:hypothetical protein
MARTTLVSALILSLLAAPGARAAEYVESFDGPLTSVMLNGALSTGASGGWSVEVREGALVLSNPEAANALRYIGLENVIYPGSASPASTNNATIEATVRAKAEERAGAGVLAGYDPRTGNYVFFAVSGGGAYFATRKDQNRVKIIAAGTSAAIKPGAANKVSASTRDRTLVFSVNGTEVLRVQEPGPVEQAGRSSLPQGQRLVGLAAFGRGTFWFEEARIAPPFSNGITNPQPASEAPRERRPGSTPGDTLE